MEPLRIIEVEVINFQGGGMVAFNSQRHFAATERAPGFFRVNDGTYDFSFYQFELDEAKWIKEVK